MSDPELMNNLNLLFRILKQVDEEEIPSVCVDENGVYYPADDEKEKEEELIEKARRVVGIYVGPIAIYGINEYGEPYVCIINPRKRVSIKRASEGG